jgi:hypothetical protein
MELQTLGPMPSRGGLKGGADHPWGPYHRKGGLLTLGPATIYNIYIYIYYIYIAIYTSVNMGISILVSDETESRQAELSGAEPSVEQFLQMVFEQFVRRHCDSESLGTKAKLGKLGLDLEVISNRVFSSPVDPEKASSRAF